MSQFYQNISLHLGHKSYIKQYRLELSEQSKFVSTELKYFKQVLLSFMCNFYSQ